MDIFLQLVINGLLIGGVYGLVSVGLTLVFGVLKIVNFAHGELLMLGMFAGFWAYKLLGLDPNAAAFLILPLFFAFGLAIYYLLIRPVLSATALAQFFCTIGLSVFLQNFALLAWGADLRSVRTPYSQSYFEIGEITVSVARVTAFGASILLSAALLAFLRYTFMGKAMRAMVQNKQAAVLIGIPVGRVYALAFGMGVACVGAAGAILVPIFQIYPSIGLNFVLTAFVVVVLGGMGSVSGAIVGGLIVGLVEALSGYFIAPTVKEVVYYVIFLGILLVRPSGLFGILGSEEVGLR
jgi:branched-chain amino acid transport system permease protein